jgi:hypothetical protein
MYLSVTESKARLECVNGKPLKPSFIYVSEKEQIFGNIDMYCNGVFFYLSLMKTKNKLQASCILSVLKKNI